MCPLYLTNAGRRYPSGKEVTFTSLGAGSGEADVGAAEAVEARFIRSSWWL